MNTDQHREWIRQKEELDLRCKDGTIFNATDEELKGYLSSLCHGAIENDRIRHLFINRLSLINTIRTTRFMEKSESSSTKLSIAAITVSIIATFAALYSVYDSSQTAKTLEQLVHLQRQELAEVRRVETLNKSMQPTPAAPAD